MHVPHLNERIIEHKYECSKDVGSLFNSNEDDLDKRSDISKKIQSVSNNPKQPVQQFSFNSKLSQETRISDLFDFDEATSQLNQPKIPKLIESEDPTLPMESGNGAQVQISDVQIKIDA